MSWRDHIKGYWKFDENDAGIIYADSSANAKHLALTYDDQQTSYYHITGKIDGGARLYPVQSPGTMPNIAFRNFTDPTGYIFDAFTIRGYFNSQNLEGGIGGQFIIKTDYYSGGEKIIYGLELDINSRQLTFQVGHQYESSSVVKSVLRSAGYYGDEVWREFICSFKKQTNAPRMKIWIDGVDESTDEASYNESVETAVLAEKTLALCSNNTGIGVDDIVLLDDVFTPADFIEGNELVDQRLIYPGIPQLI